jgi:hypothetical protein|tara:strand:- start:1728 stop:2609 length:882 start_codon:yes stop_codon:yes gene_type:complete
MKQQLQEDSTTDSLQITIWDHNRREIPSAGTISIYDGPTQLVSSATATIAADGTCSYTPGTTVTDVEEENLKAEWTLTIDSEAKVFIQLFDVVPYPLYPMVTDEDLISECAQLQEERYLAYGTADSGTTTMLVDIDLSEYRDNHWQGGTLEITAGTNSGSKRIVSAFAKDTGTVTVTSAFGSAIDSTSKYLLRRTFQREIDRAWDDLQAKILQKGNRPALIMNSDELKPVHIMTTLEKICRDLSTTEGDIWWAKATHYMEQASAWWNNAVFIYDVNEDKVPDTKLRNVLEMRR